MTRRRIITALTLVCLIMTACGGGDDEAESATLQVFVDTRLQGVAERLAEAFHAENPGVTLELEVGDSPELADRIRSGERVDLIIGERQEVDQLAAEEVIAGETLILGTDLLEIAVPQGNPADVVGLDGFSPESPVRSGICMEGTVCGALARRLLAEAGLPADGPERTDVNPIEMLGLLVNRDLDAGILLRSQRAAAVAPLDAVSIPLEFEERMDYSVAGIEDNATVERTARWLATDPASGEVLVTGGLRTEAGEPAS